MTVTILEEVTAKEKGKSGEKKSGEEEEDKSSEKKTKKKKIKTVDRAAKLSKLRSLLFEIDCKLKMAHFLNERKIYPLPPECVRVVPFSLTCLLKISSLFQEGEKLPTSPEEVQGVLRRRVRGALRGGELENEGREEKAAVTWTRQRGVEVGGGEERTPS